MNLRMKDAIERISSDLDLSGPDAAVYVHLCAAGPAKASDLADALHVHRNDVYRTTERLVQRGLLETTMERPARFVAVDPEQVFDQEISHRLAAIESLRRSRSDVLALVSQLQSLAPPSAKGVYKILQGRPAIHAQRDHMIEDAHESVEIVSSHAATLHHADVNGTLDLLLQRANQGVDVRLLLRTTPEDARRLEPLRRLPNVQAREFLCDVPVRFTIVDGKSLLIWVVDDASESLYASDEVGMYTTAGGFVAAQRQFLATAWQAAPRIAGH